MAFVRRMGGVVLCYEEGGCAVSYQALYRAWRPQTFADLVGQPHVKQTLTNALAHGRVAHAYLFCGPRGTGKTSTAKILAKAVNCLQPQGVEPCNACRACESITAGTNVDVEEIDAASNRGVDEIRQLREKVQYAPASLKRKVYIVDEVHMLTPEAFNALLKTLEEPPHHTLFVLATTEPHRIPATIVSRCQRFDFRRIPEALIVERLRAVCADNGWAYEDEALFKLAEAADGGLRDALGLLEQTAAYSQGRIGAQEAAHVVGGLQASDVVALVAALYRGDLPGALVRLTEWYMAGRDAGRIVQEMLAVLRDLAVVRLRLPEAAQEPRWQAYAEVAAACPLEWLLAAIDKLGDVYTHLRFVDQPRLVLETALFGIARLARGQRAAAPPDTPALAAPAQAYPAVPRR
ncbi:DNA polymerase III subunit gamma/tau, partial [Alicyclobacillus cellulosilyticus]|uniref:DNA polymerase III subunit gamma/tau n=1 Tax=Alicyclobacillus cellulosilyticus TaxID=1003997 RepID=UPI0027E4DA04